MMAVVISTEIERFALYLCSSGSYNISDLGTTAARTQKSPHKDSNKNLTAIPLPFQG